MFLFYGLLGLINSFTDAQCLQKSKPEIINMITDKVQVLSTIIDKAYRIAGSSPAC